MRNVEANLLAQRLQLSGGHITQAAWNANVAVSQIFEKLKKLNQIIG